mgnify:CR=1 FL=1
MSQISRKKMRCTYFFYFERREKHPHCFDVWEAVGMLSFWIMYTKDYELRRVFLQFIPS